MLKFLGETQLFKRKGLNMLPTEIIRPELQYYTLDTKVIQCI